VAVMTCGLLSWTVEDQPLTAVVARMVTVPLKRSFHFCPSEYVAVQAPEPPGGGVVGGGVVGSVGSPGSAGEPPPLRRLRTEVYACFLLPAPSKSSGVPLARHESLSR